MDRQAGQALAGARLGYGRIRNGIAGGLEPDGGQCTLGAHGCGSDESPGFRRPLIVPLDEFTPGRRTVICSLHDYNRVRAAIGSLARADEANVLHNFYVPKGKVIVAKIQDWEPWRQG